MTIFLAQLDFAQNNKIYLAESQISLDNQE